MWGLILKVAAWALGIFSPAKDERDAERAAGEDLGAAKAGQTAAVGELHDIEKANSARNAVSDDAGSVMLDPANAGPASPSRAN